MTPCVRTSQASREIKRLIQDSISKLENGTQLVDRSGQSLAEMVNSAKHMGEMVARIATASAEQSTGVEQVNSAIAQIDRVTKTNSAQTASLAETSESLSQQTAGLMVLVREFNSNTGSRTSARAAKIKPVNMRSQHWIDHSVQLRDTPPARMRTSSKPTQAGLRPPTRESL